MLLWLLRACYLALLLGLAVFTFAFFFSEDPVISSLASGCILLGGGVVFWTDLREKQKQIAIISAVYFGLLFGLLLGYLLTLAVEPIIESAYSAPPERVKQAVLIWRFVLSVVCCYITISTLLQTKDEFRFIIPYVEFSKQLKGPRPLVLDTSVIIDGRIADLCETKLVEAKLIVPRFVLQELQGIADSSDKMKRNRGRRGLDILKKLQSNQRIELQIQEGSIGEIQPGEKVRVDERLVLFAKVLGGRVVTNDFNLNKIAQLQGVDVINLNEVANALKTVALPGEYLLVKVVKPGDQFGQGVGYLEDGTMVVIESGRNLLGQDASIVVTSVLQTPAGRMIFGRPEARPSGAYSPVQPNLPPTGSGSQQPVTTNPASGSIPSSSGPGSGSYDPNKPPPK
jgi:uncharacterized protein YacL